MAFQSNGKSEKEDLDTFLTTIESKLRGPFSSLDLAKSVSTNALRGSLTPSQYLQNLSKVLSRTDKVIQSRMLIGLLGLDPTPETTVEIHKILHQAQEAPAHEEWVRAIAGLIQGIMFERTEDRNQMDSEDTGSHEQNEDGSTRTCRGEEAQTLLDGVCDEVLEKVENAVQESLQDETLPPDLNATFVPYRFSLLPAGVSKRLIPEACGENPHFKVNRDAAVLKIDEDLELKRAKDEEEHQGPILMKGKVGSVSASSSGGAAKARSDLPPGFRPAKLVSSSTNKAKVGGKAGATSMFMPKKPNALLAQRQKQLQQKAALRRKGSAQSVVNSSSLKQRLAAKTGGTAGTTSNALAGRSAKFGGASSRALAARSKMKMIDIQEVGSLNKEHTAREQAANSRMSKKRRILDAAMQRGLKKTKTEPESAPVKSEPSNSSSSNQEAEAPKQQQQTQQPVKSEPAAPTSGGANEPEWKILLRERSNKLSEQDRQRVQQFFESRLNPTPDQQVVKMKLHEQRSNEAGTGQAIKETFYLELDYTNFTSKQSKKVKRY